MLRTLSEALFGFCFRMQQENVLFVSCKAEEEGAKRAHGGAGGGGDQNIDPGI